MDGSSERTPDAVYGSRHTGEVPMLADCTKAREALQYECRVRSLMSSIHTGSCEGLRVNTS